MNFDLEGMLKSAATGVFNTMLSLDVQFNPPNENFFDGEAHIAGAVGFTGDYNGVIYLYASAKFARKITGILLGISDEEIEGNEMVNDALGELTNMVAGHIKSRLCDRGAACVMTIPAVVRGNDFRIEPVSGANRQTLYFQCNGGQVLVEVLIKPTEDKQ